MEIFSTILLIYIIIIFINFIYINRDNYVRIDKDHAGDIVVTIIASPIFLLYNLSKYGIPIKLPKKSKPEYTGGFRWGDLVMDSEGRAGIYVGYGRIVYEGSSSYEYLGETNISIQYRGEVAEELAMLDESTKLQKKANELLAKKKKTIYN